MSSTATVNIQGNARPVVLITGAAGGGIGTCTAIRFAEAGYNVVATDIKPLEAVQKAVEDTGAQCLALHLDVCKADSVQAAIKKALETFGKIDCLVNNAAASLGTGLHDCTDEIWDASIQLTLKSVFLVSKAVLPSMMERKSGVIINIASVNGQSGIGEEAYSAAKAGVINLTSNMAVRYGPDGIRAVCIAPGTIETHLWKERLAKSPKVLENLKKYYPLGRIGQGRDVANAAYFLASPDASWITGTTLNVDGGLMAGSSQLQKDLVPE